MTRFWLEAAGSTILKYVSCDSALEIVSSKPSAVESAAALADFLEVRGHKLVRRVRKRGVLQILRRSQPRLDNRAEDQPIGLRLQADEGAEREDERLPGDEHGHDDGLARAGETFDPVPSGGPSSGLADYGSLSWG